MKNKKMPKEVIKIKHLMMESLEGQYKEFKDKNGTYHTICTGDYVCHEDIPFDTPQGFDAHFTVCGEKESQTYLVLIQKIKI